MLKPIKKNKHSALMIVPLFICIINNSLAAIVPYDKCFINAAAEYKVPKEVLIAIASVESRFKPNAMNYNSNGSYDIGVMQINSIWLKQLNKDGINEDTLKEPCVNIKIGAWILSQKIKAYGFNWTAIQRYNGSDGQLQYAKKVYAAIKAYYPTFNDKDNKMAFVENIPEKAAEPKKGHFLSIQ